MLQTEAAGDRLPGYRDEDIILFEEGLVGFPGCTRFVLMESEAFAPFRLLQCVDQTEVGFFVLDPRNIVKNYNRSIPDAAWRALGVAESTARLALVTSIIGRVPEESTANLQAPLLINYKQMAGRQLILANSRYSVTQPLVPTIRRRVMAAGKPN